MEWLMGGWYGGGCGKIRDFTIWVLRFGYITAPSLWMVLKFSPK